MLDDATYEEWDKAAFQARHGDPKPLAAFLRAHAGRWPEIELDLAQVADLLEGKVRRPRGKPSAAMKMKWDADPVARAASGAPEALLARLEALHIALGLDVPNLRLIAAVVRGDFKRSPGPFPGSRLEQALDAWDIVKLVREARDRLRREGEPHALEDAWHAVAQVVHKSDEWVRDEYYKMHQHHPEPVGDADAQVLEGVGFVGDEHNKLPGELLEDSETPIKKPDKSP